MARKSRNFSDMVTFWGLEQATQILPLRNARQAGRPHCTRAGWASWKARPQWPVPVRIGPKISNAVA